MSPHSLAHARLSAVATEVGHRGAAWLLGVPLLEGLHGRVALEVLAFLRSAQADVP